MAALGLDPVRVSGVAAQAISASNALERPSSSQRGVPDSFAVRRPVVLSATTATYDRSGSYPKLHLFQLARPLPESRPYGSLNVSLDPGARRALVSGSYLRPSGSSGTAVNALV